MRTLASEKICLKVHLAKLSQVLNYDSHLKSSRTCEPFRSAVKRFSEEGGAVISQPQPLNDLSFLPAYMSETVLLNSDIAPAPRGNT